MGRPNPSLSNLKRGQDSPSSQLLISQMAGINLSKPPGKGVDPSDHVDEDEETVKAKITMMVEKDIKYYTKLYNLLKKRQLKPNQPHQQPQIPTQSLKLQEIRFLDESQLQGLDVDTRNSQASLTGFKQSQQSPMAKQAQPKITPVQSQPAQFQQQPQQFAPQPQVNQAQLQFMLQQQQQQQQQVQFMSSQGGQQLKPQSPAQQAPTPSLTQQAQMQNLSQKPQQPQPQQGLPFGQAPNRPSPQTTTLLSSLLTSQAPVIGSPQPKPQQVQAQPPQQQPPSLLVQNKQASFGTPPNSAQTPADSGANTSISQPSAPAVNLFGAPTTSTPFSFGASSGTQPTKPAGAQPAPTAQKSLFQSLPAAENKPVEESKPLFQLNMGAKPVVNLTSSASTPAVSTTASAPANSLPASLTTQLKQDTASQPPKFSFGLPTNTQSSTASIGAAVKTQIPVPVAETKPPATQSKPEQAQSASQPTETAKPAAPATTAAPVASQIPVPLAQGAKPAGSSLFGSSTNIFGSAGGGASAAAPFSFGFGGDAKPAGGSLFGSATSTQPKPAETAPKEEAAKPEATQKEKTSDAAVPSTAVKESAKEPQPKPEAKADAAATQPASAAASNTAPATSTSTAPAPIAPVAATTTQPPMGSLFGSLAKPSATPVFGAPSSTAQAPSLFGAAASSTAQPPAASAATTAAPATGTGLFSGFLAQTPQAPQAAANPFAALTANKPQPPTSGSNNELDMADMDSGNGGGGGGLSFGGMGFGTKQPDPAAAAKNVFGGGGSLFGSQPSSGQTTSLFGGQPAAASGAQGGILKTSTFGFGAGLSGQTAQQQQPAPAFGASAAPSAFGGAANTSSAGGGLFSSFKTPQKPGLFFKTFPHSSHTQNKDQTSPK